MRRTPLARGTTQLRRTPIKARRTTKRSERSEYDSDAAWRMAVMEAGHWRCASCGDTRYLEADHIIPRSQGGLSDVANGLILCGEFGRGRCHPRKTAGALRISFSWLRPDQAAYLYAKGWATRHVSGDHSWIGGRGWRHFTD